MQRWSCRTEEILDTPPPTIGTHFVLTSVGKTDQAIIGMKRAQELDPLSLRISADLGMAHFAGCKYDESFEQERKTLEMDPKFHAVTGFSEWL